MSKSRVRPLNTVLTSLPSEADRLSKSNAEQAGVRAPQRRSFSTQLAAVVRWLHIYVSLLGFTALILFAVTGITLNHPTWFGDAQQTAQFTGKLDLSWLSSLSESEEPAERGSEEQVARLEIVEHLRQAHSLRGAVSEFQVDDRECMVVFKGPGYSADAFIDRASGEYNVTETALGTVAIINDLHKGRDTGAVWSLVIDISALLMVFVSITGIVLIFYLKRRRWSGLLTAVAGTIAVALLYLFGVP